MPWREDILRRKCTRFLLVVFATLIYWGASPHAASASTAEAATGGEASTEVEATKTAQKEDKDAALFITRCSGCHTIGSGNLKGPDLLPVTQWSESELRPAIKRMEKQVGPLSDDDVQRLLLLFGASDVQERLKKEQARSVREMMAKFDPSVEVGRKLFHGEQALANGGLPCSSCHAVIGKGGEMGPDLTLLGENMPTTAMRSAFEKTNFNVMRAAYRDHPVTLQEAWHMAAYFEALAEAPKTVQAVDNDGLWVAFGGGIFGLLIALALGFFYSRRQPGTRARLIQQSMRK